MGSETTRVACWGFFQGQEVTQQLKDPYYPAWRPEFQLWNAGGEQWPQQVALWLTVSLQIDAKIYTIPTFPIMKALKFLSHMSSNFQWQMALQR